MGSSNVRGLPLAALLLRAASSTTHPNVVYVLSDDLRADLGAYGLPVVTPHIDALAADGLTFAHAFCQMSVCSPSRQSFMTGLRPDTHRVWNFIDANPTRSRSVAGWFRDHGYAALGLGKTFHEDAGAWNADAYWNTTLLPYYPYEANACPKPSGGEGGGHCAEPDAAIYDARLLNATLAALDVAAAHEPFFLMSGFRDPHAPWAAPQRMYDLYDEADIAVAAHQVLPAGAPRIAWSNCLDVRLANGTSFAYGPEKAVPDWVARDQRRAYDFRRGEAAEPPRAPPFRYYAAVSYVDEHVGAIVAALRDGGKYDESIVVFHSDHGYHLGEHGEREPAYETRAPSNSRERRWEKKSNFDLAVRVPLIVKTPFASRFSPASRGRKTRSFAELVDVFPTLAALAGLPAPPGVDGDDVSAVFERPDALLKSIAYHQYPACDAPSLNATRSECNGVAKEKFDFMGYSLRTPAWRYTLWLAWNGTALAADWDGESAEELYAHAGDDSSDMDAYENENAASSRPDVAAALRSRLAAFFRKDGAS